MSEISELRRANQVWSLRLPPGAEPPVVAFVNGEERAEGAGITFRDGRVEFDPPLHARPKMGIGRSVMLALGIGVYGDLRGDTLDIVFRRNGRTESLSDIKLVPTPRTELQG